MAEAEARGAERLRAHYDVERTLADRLRSAGADERRALYGVVYDELFQQVPDHPQLTRKADPSERRADLSAQLTVLRRFLTPGCTFMEVGAGDCALSFALAKEAGTVYAIDVSSEITSAESMPPNVSLVLSDGVSIPVPGATVDVAYSNQLMEHLHPDDAREQLANIHAALAPGGVYICVTPNRLSGPHDISAYFDDVARGFHLKEYTIGELATLIGEAGFQRVSVLARVRRRTLVMPQAPVAAVERVLGRLPRRTSRRIARDTPLRLLLDTVVATRAR